jgi:hypothetical protein
MSRYSGVDFDLNNSKWIGEFDYFGKDLFCGYWNTEIDAARAVNQKCIELEIPLKNPSLGEIKPAQQPPRKTRYNCVIWDDQEQKWHATFEHKGLTLSIGYFTSDYNAAREINLKCQELGIEPRNPQLQVASRHYNSSDGNGDSGTNGNGESHHNGYDNGNGLNGYDNNGHDNGNSLNGYDNGNGLNGHDNGLNGHFLSSNGNEKTSSGNGRFSSSNDKNHSSSGDNGNGYDNGNGLNGHDTNGHNDNGNGFNGYNGHVENGNGYSNSSENGLDMGESSMESLSIDPTANPPENWEAEMEALMQQLQDRNRILHEQKRQMKEKDETVQTNQNALEEAKTQIQEQKTEIEKQDEILNNLQN